MPATRLRVIADRCLWRLVDEGARFEQALTVATLLTEACLDMIEGQYLDLSFEGRRNIRVADYLGMISRKTGALIRCALTVGAHIGARDEAKVQAFRDCGRALGFVFQIRDDILGIWGDEGTTGKPVGADIKRKKNSLPVVYAMSEAQGADRERLLSIYKAETVGGEEVETVVDILEGVGARQYCESLARKHCEAAIASINSAEVPPEAIRDMEQVAQFLLVREH